MFDIDIVINAYNSAATISETLESIKSAFEPHSFKVQIILVDNQSNDDTQRIFESFNTNNDVRLSYVETPHFMTIGAARIFALSHIRSDLFAFVDSDDLISSNWPLRLSSMKSNRHAWAVGSVLTFAADGERGRLIRPYVGPFFRYTQLVTNRFALCGVIFPRGLIKILEPFESLVREMEYCPDYVFVLLCQLRFGEPHCSNAVCAFYRIGTDSLTIRKGELIKKEIRLSRVACISGFSPISRGISLFLRVLGR